MLPGVNLVHVPYRSAPAAQTDLISGQVQVMFDNLPNSIEAIRSGSLRPLAVEVGIAAWGADYNDAQNFLSLFETSTKQRKPQCLANANSLALNTSTSIASCHARKSISASSIRPIIPTALKSNRCGSPGAGGD
ncbi:MAG: hypothetical protein JO047_07970 [Alphaproteobacteria bacterium]|nr:hypothetical protein [Alphaproteobacteria bacterium]